MTFPPAAGQKREGSGPHVFAILLAYNDWDDIGGCLDALTRSDYPRLDIVIVDNGTAAWSAEARAAHPQVSVIENGRNLGYAEGNNVGLRYALERGADYALILNGDVVAAPDAVSRLVHAAEQDPQAALLGPLVYHWNEPDIVQSAGGLVTPFWQFYHRGQNLPDEGQFRETEPVAWITGCAILARCAALGTLGLIDPAFFMYDEEVDWCLRASQAGYHVLCVPQAKVWHKGVQRDYRPSPLITYLSARNELLLLRKHHAGAMVMTWTWLRHLRTLAAWSLFPRWRSKRPHRDALAMALRDYAQRRFGAPPLFLNEIATADRAG